jgi:hypothetical protein
MSSRVRLLAPLTAALLALLIAGPAAADPVTRVIAPKGSGIECSMANPCSYGYAFTIGSNAGDTVLALPGPYDVTAAPPSIAHPLTVMGDPSKPRPVFVNYDPSNTWALNLATGAGGSVLKHLDIRGHNGVYVHDPVDASDLAITAQSYCVIVSGSGSTLSDSSLNVSSPVAGARCADIMGASTLRHVTVNAPGANGVTLEWGGATLEDSAITADYPLYVTDGSTSSDVRRVSLTGTKQVVSAMQFGWVNITDSVLWTTGASTSAVDTQRGGKATLRNDTIIAGGSGSIGLDAEAAISGMPPGSIDARNLIVHASADDLRSLVASDPSQCKPVPCLPGYLRIDHSLFASSIGPVLDEGSNVSGDPMFADPALGNFRLRPGSPAIDAGAADALSGATDFDGAARIQGSAVDLGAFESAPQAPPVSPVAPAADGAAAPPASPAARDLIAPVLSAISVRRRSTLRYRVSESAQVTIRLARRVTKTRFRKIETLTRGARLGVNSTKLTARMKRHVLAPGTYRITLVARDQAGNKSRSVTVKFSVRG